MTKNNNQNYNQKYQEFLSKISYDNLPLYQKEFIKDKSLLYQFSFSQVKQLHDIAVDLYIWNEDSIDKIWQDTIDNNLNNKNPKQARKLAFEHILKVWNRLKIEQKDYAKLKDIEVQKLDKRSIEILPFEDKSAGLGMCPVASPKTRCCNLLTLDAVESCGFDCSYCSIQSFYNQNRVFINPNLDKKLNSLEIDSNYIYHIGTGQSSDSLMWGNKANILTHLFEFASKNPNVILELKTKSDNIKYLLENEVPKNVIVTWSLNPQIIIDNEERLTASLDSRIQSAYKLAQKGVLVGFHFHPMMIYKGYEKDYKAIFDELLKKFKPSQVAMVSLGTLTFIKPVIKQIRHRDFKSKILQMPLIECEGKLSYSLEQKLDMFRLAYDSLKVWADDSLGDKKVFFYMCMEPHILWDKVFGYSYYTNNEFEEAMKSAYMNKIKIL